MPLYLDIMSAIYNFKPISARLACSGQPRESQLPDIASDGYRVVVNLGLANAKYALKDEEASVTQLKIIYYHIPVLFEHPDTTSLARFIEIMDQHQSDKTLVHCAANYRASVFTGLYLMAKKIFTEQQMRDMIEEVWQPDAVWEQFIEEATELLNAAN